MRALGRGTFYAFTGCGLLAFCVWKLMGVHSVSISEYSEQLNTVVCHSLYYKKYQSPSYCMALEFDFHLIFLVSFSSF